VFGARAADAMQEAPGAAALKADRRTVASEPLMSAPGAVLDLAGVRDVMWRSAGLFRSRDHLRGAVLDLTRSYLARADAVRAEPADGDAWRTLNLTTVALLIARAALRREESRGGHFRIDFPQRDDANWSFHAIDRRGPDSPDPLSHRRIASTFPR
jgi:L-aspartate oxidase